MPGRASRCPSAEVFNEVLKIPHISIDSAEDA
jgi:hypothetical protein